MVREADGAKESEQLEDELREDHVEQIAIATCVVGGEGACVVDELLLAGGALKAARDHGGADQGVLLADAHEDEAVHPGVGGFLDGLLEEALTMTVRVLLLLVFRGANTALFAEPGLEALTTAVARLGKLGLLKGERQAVLPLRGFQELVDEARPQAPNGPAVRRASLVSAVSRVTDMMGSVDEGRPMRGREATPARRPPELVSRASNRHMDANTLGNWTLA